ncbi:hypothetical protein MD484_g8988, partial [Candolleomyces efflorescens]
MNVTETEWDGTVNHELSSDSEFCFTDSDLAESSGEDDQLLEMEGDDQLLEMEGDDLHHAANHELEGQVDKLKRIGAFGKLMNMAKELTPTLWKKAEDRQQSGINTGASKCTQQRRDKNLRDKEEKDKELQKS